MKIDIDRNDERLQNILEGKEIPAICAKKYEEYEKQLDKVEQELAFYQDEIKNRGTCGLCEKLENKQIKKLEQQLAEKDKQLEEIRKSQKITFETLMQTDKELAIREKALKQVIKNMYHLDREYFIGTPPTEEEYCKNNFKYWIEQAKESLK